MIVRLVEVDAGSLHTVGQFDVLNLDAAVFDAKPVLLALVIYVICLFVSNGVFIEVRRVEVQFAVLDP